MSKITRLSKLGKDVPEVVEYYQQINLSGWYSSFLGIFSIFIALCCILFRFYATASYSLVVVGIIQFITAAILFQKATQGYSYVKNISLKDFAAIEKNNLMRAIDVLHRIEQVISVSLFLSIGSFVFAPRNPPAVALAFETVFMRIFFTMVKIRVLSYLVFLNKIVLKKEHKDVQH